MTTDTICRIALAGFLVIAAGLSGRYRRDADRKGGRVSRSQDPRWFWIGMVFVFPPIMFGYLAFIINPDWIAWSHVALPSWLRASGVALGLIALLGFRWMFRHLGANVTPTSMPRENATLITSGPYRWIRHPMYSFGFLLFVSFTLLSSSWFIATGVGLAFMLLALRSGIEEARLIEKFGDDYQIYRRRTGRFLPRLIHPAT